MTAIIRFVQKNKFATWLFVMIVTAGGLYAGLTMKMETIPDISPPVVTVTTAFPGAPPQEVADEVTEPLQRHIQHLPGVEVVSSTSYTGVSVLQIQYQFDKNMERAEEEVQEAIEELSLPEKAQPPEVARVQFNSFPILSLSVSDKQKSLQELTEIVHKEIVPALEGIDGVARVEVSGGIEKKVVLDFKEPKLHKYGLDENTIQKLIRANNLHQPLGIFTLNEKQKSVVISGGIKTVKDLKQMPIPVLQGDLASRKNTPEGFRSSAKKGESNGQSMQTKRLTGVLTVPLKEVAELEIVQKAESISRTNGDRSIGLQIVKADRANTVEVASEVRNQFAQFEKKYDTLTLTTMFSQADPIEQSVHTMLNKALFGAVFAALIILLFLRHVKSTIIAVISIPLSVLMAILLLNEMEMTLNVMTLGAMTVAIGRVIDDSIVVIENIYRRFSLQKEPIQRSALIRAATKEMFIPILSSTLVTIAVFIPLGLLKGPVGELFLPFALTVVFALSASLLVAVTVVPMLADSFLRRPPQKGGNRQASKIFSAYYKKMLQGALNHKALTFGGAVIFLGASLFLIPQIGASFLPQDRENRLILTYNPSPGQTLQDIKTITSRAESYFLHQKNVTKLQYSVGGKNPFNPGAAHQALFFVQYRDDFEKMEQMEKKVLHYLNKSTSYGEWETMMVSASSDTQLELYVYSDERGKLERAVKQIKRVLEKRADLQNIDTSIAKTYDQYTLTVDLQKLGAYGLTAAQVATKLSRLGDPLPLTTIQVNGESRNVYVRGKEKEYDSLDELLATEISTPFRFALQTGKVVQVKEGKAPDAITERHGQIYASISAEVTTDDLAAVSRAVEEAVAKLTLPENTDVQFAGVTDQMRESFSQLGIAMLAAVAIVYLILVITFGEALAPFAIIFSLPFAVIGGLFGLYLADETISVSALIGALMLIGIVVTNAIVLIDRVCRNEEKGFTVREALLEAGMTRLQPILMTALATVGALFPLALEAEGGALISRGLAVTVIGGLTSSTLLTLVIVPIVYEFLSRFRRQKVDRVERGD